MKRSCLVALALLLAFCGVAAVGAVPNPDTFIWATFAGWDSFDPAWCYDTSSGEAIYHIYDSLVGYVDTSLAELRPILATAVPSVENGLIKVAADGSATVRFPIRQNVKFHNGDTLTAQDVAYCFQRLVLCDVTAGPAWIITSQLLGKDTLAQIIEEVGADAAYDRVMTAIYVPADDPNAVEFKMPRLSPYFLKTVADSASWGYVYSKRFAIENGAWDGKKANWQNWFDQPKEELALYDKACGTGPFLLDGTPDPVAGYTLTRFDGYWDQVNLPKIKRVEVVYVEEWTTRKLMLVNGTADAVDIPRQFKAQVEGTPGVRTVYDLPSGRNDALLLNLNVVTEGNERLGSGKLDGAGIPSDFFTDLHVRRAFAYLFPYQRYIDQVMMGEATKTTSVIPTFMPFYNPDQEQFEYDPEKAFEELKLAWDGEVFEHGFWMRLDYNAGNVARQTACEMLRDELRKLDIRFNVEVRGLPWANYLDDNRARRMTMFFIGWQWDYPDEDNYVTPYYSSNGTYGGRASFSVLGDVATRLDELIVAERAQADPDQRREIFYEIQKVGHENALVTMYSQQTVRRWMRTWVGGYWYNSSWNGWNFRIVYKADGATVNTALLGEVQHQVAEW